MISIIVAIDKNNLIGKENEMPWHYKADLKYFKEITTGKTVAMGRKTYLSIGRPLTNRKNIIFTKKEMQIEGAVVKKDLREFLEKNKNNEEEIFIIGGANIYKQALPYAEKLYITHIDEEYEGDTHFPKINYSNYNEIREIKNGKLTFTVYERNQY